jgi:hypothetical protein
VAWQRENGSFQAFIDRTPLGGWTGFIHFEPVENGVPARRTRTIQLVVCRCRSRERSRSIPLSCSIAGSATEIRRSDEPTEKRF